MKYSTAKVNLDNRPHISPRDRQAVRAAMVLFELDRDELVELAAALRREEEEAAVKLSIAQVNLDRAQKARAAVEHLLNG